IGKAGGGEGGKIPVGAGPLKKAGASLSPWNTAPRDPCAPRSPRRSELGLFFFQAEDGIRDVYVTGVQTCALPIRSEEHTSELQSRRDLVCRIIRSEEHTSELQSRRDLVCRLLLEKKKKQNKRTITRYTTRLQSSRWTVHHPRISPSHFPRLHPRPPSYCSQLFLFFFFFFNDTATTEIYPLSLHDALPI